MNELFRQKAQNKKRSSKNPCVRKPCPIYRTRQSQAGAFDLYPSGEKSRRSVGSCPLIWSARLRENNDGNGDRQRDAGPNQDDQRSCDRKPGDLIAILNELQPGMFCLSMRSIACLVSPKKCFIRQWKIFMWISWWGRDNGSPSSFPLPPFTLVGATTRAGMLSAPLRDRFGIISHMQYYEDHDLKEIVQRTASIFETDIVEEGAIEIARRSRGTPRIANRLLKRVRDYAQVQADGLIDRTVADQALALLAVDHAGLDYIDQKLIRTMIELYQGGPVGLSTIAVNIGEETETVEDMYEPFLIQKGFLKRTSRGRIATPLAYDHFGYPQRSE